MLDDPEIGDDAYDALLDELRAIEAEHPELVTPDSPTQRVGGEPVSDLEKVRHPQPMLSLANVRSADELRAWVQRMRNHLAREGIEEPEFEFVAEPKIDGLAMSLLYRDGVFERGATRGNGEVGEDVTHNLRTIGAIPLRLEIDDPPALVEVRGEVYMSLPDFAALNERRAEQGLSTFMNPRNSAAGTIRQLDPKLAAERPLSFWAYPIGVTDGISFDSHWEALEWLRDHRFPVHPDVRKLETEDEVVAQCRAWEARRGSLDFEIDGVVVKVNSARAAAPARRRRARPALGDRVEVPADDGRHEAERDRLEPRQVRRPAPVRDARAGPGRRRDDQDGDAAQRGGPRPQGHPRGRGGDRAARRRRDPAGALAGAARRRAPRPPAAAARRPQRCPVCDTPTVKPEDSVFTRCPNRDCPGRRWQLLKHFAGAMDIDGLGEKQVDLFMRPRLGAHRRRLLPADAPSRSPSSPGSATVSADKLIAAIDASKRQPFGRVLFAVGIEEVGDVTGRNLAQQFRTLDALLAADPEAIEQTPGVGPKMATVIHEQLADPQMRALIDRPARRGPALRGRGPAARARARWPGKTFVLTGTLPELTREQATERIIGAGGR